MAKIEAVRGRDLQFHSKQEKTLEHDQSGCVKHEILETFTIYVTHISSRDEMTLFQFVSKTIRNPEKRRADVVTFGGGALRDIPEKQQWRKLHNLRLLGNIPPPDRPRQGIFVYK